MKIDKEYNRTIKEYKFLNFIKWKIYNKLNASLLYENFIT